MANTKLKHLHQLFIEDRKKGMMGNEIARKYNVNNVTVWNVLKKAGLNKSFSLEEKFWKNVNKKSNEECWEWIGCKFNTNYGAIGDGYKTLNAHRVSYELHNGPIPDDLVVRHKCDNRSCVNPNHLELGTHADNIKDRDERGRSRVGEKHYKARLTENDILEIVKLYNQGVGTYNIAKRFNTTGCNIWFIVTGKTWKSVTSKLNLS